MENHEGKINPVYLQVNVGSIEKMVHINNVNLYPPFACNWFLLPFE
jgi:hypothetical protein